MKARREAMAADVVVVNHHLFFADMALRDSGVAELLPSGRGGGVRRGAPADGHRRAVPRPDARPRRRRSTSRATCSAPACSRRAAWRPGRSSPARCDHAARELRLAAAAARSARCAAALKLRWAERAAEAELPSAALARRRRGAARGAPRRSSTVQRDRRPTSPLHERADAPAPRSRGAFGERAATGQVRWIDLSPHQARLVESPLDIRDALREQMRGGAARPGSSPRPRSATTIASAGSPSRPVSSDARTLRLGSPFDYAATRASTCRARFSEAERARPRRRVGRARRALRRGARRPHLRADDDAARAADRRRRSCAPSSTPQGAAHRGAGAGPGPKRQLMQRFLARRAACWSARRASGKASTCPATRCSAW